MLKRQFWRNTSSFSYCKDRLDEEWRLLLSQRKIYEKSFAR